MSNSLRKIACFALLGNKLLVKPEGSGVTIQEEGGNKLGTVLIVPDQGLGIGDQQCED
jgi:hypothetical protein